MSSLREVLPAGAKLPVLVAQVTSKSTRIVTFTIIDGKIVDISKEVAELLGLRYSAVGGLWITEPAQIDSLLGKKLYDNQMSIRKYFIKNRIE